MLLLIFIKLIAYFSISPLDELFFFSAQKNEKKKNKNISPQREEQYTSTIISSSSSSSYILLKKKEKRKAVLIKFLIESDGMTRGALLSAYIDFQQSHWGVYPNAHRQPANKGVALCVCVTERELSTWRCLPLSLNNRCQAHEQNIYISSKKQFDIKTCDLHNDLRFEWYEATQWDLQSGLPSFFSFSWCSTQYRVVKKNTFC